MTFETLSDMQAAVGQELGVSPWLTITQEMVDQFAASTHDQQWIHTDPERARQESPFGAPIAHGFLTLSLATHFIEQIIQVKAAKMGVNYGLNKVRFPDFVPVGSRLRMRVTLTACEPYRSNGLRSVFACVMEREDSEKPACVAEWIGLTFA